jgi:ribose transport system substrate-binding protein
MIKKTYLWTLTLTVLAILLVGCSDTDTDKQTSSETPEYTIGMSQCNLGEPYRVQMNADIANAAKQSSQIAVVFKDAQNDTLRQQAQVSEFINSGVDLIIVSPKEAAPLTPVIARAYEQGIPVIVLDRRILGDKYTCFIGADNKRIGEAAGQWIAQTLKEKGENKIVELKGLMTSPPAQDRHSGFLKGLGDFEPEIIFEADTQWLEPNARKEMESCLARFDDIDLVYAHNDPAAHGAYLAAKAVDREDEMIFVGIDALPQEGLMYVKQGILAACFEYPTGGKEAVETAIKILNGKNVKKDIILKSKIFTPENIDQGGQYINIE